MQTVKHSAPNSAAETMARLRSSKIETLLSSARGPTRNGDRQSPETVIPASRVLLPISYSLPTTSLRHQDMAPNPLRAHPSITCSGDHPAPAPSTLWPKVAVFKPKEEWSFIKSRITSPLQNYPLNFGNSRLHFIKRNSFLPGIINLQKPNSS